MSISLFGAARRVAVVCLAATTLAIGFASHASAAAAPIGERAPRTATETTSSIDASVRGFHASTPITLRAGDHDVLAYAPRKQNRPLTVVYLHGIHGRAANGCPWMRSGAMSLGWLVCPSGVEQDEAGTASWGGDVFKQSVAVTSALRAAEVAGASSEPGVAVGFSQGSYVALDLVRTGLGRFRGLVLLAAPEAHPSARKLLDAGVTRVVLGAGSLDAAYAPLVEDAKRLQNEGIETRFLDLGRIGHTYVTDNTEALAEAIAWAGGPA
jgi:predicted esterase